jgi:hypothetical protein
MTPTPEVLATCLAPPGDITGSGVTNVVDVQCGLVATLWQLTGGVSAAPACLVAGESGADANCDGEILVSDVQLLIAYGLGQGLSPSIDSDVSGCPDTCELLPLGAEVSEGDSDADLAAAKAQWVQTFEPEFNTLVPRSDVTVTTEDQAADAWVTPDGVRFQLVEHPEVLDWEEGQVLASAPGQGIADETPSVFCAR